MSDVTPPPIVAVEGIDGAGKSTLVRGLADALGARGDTCHVDRLSPCMASVFRGMAGRDAQRTGRYQDILPGGFRRAAYIVDAVVQFRYRAGVHASHDWLLFDRWVQTYDVYCDGRSRHDEWYQMIAGVLPAPRVLLHVKVSPEVALDRVRGRGDWCVDNWTTRHLLDDLRRLDDGYERCMASYPEAVRLDGEAEPAGLLAQALAAVDAAMVGAAVIDASSVEVPV